MRLRLLCLLVLLSWPGLSHANLLEQIAAYHIEVQDRLGRKDALYDYDYAPATMEKAMREGGVEYSLRYAGSWGGALYLDWSTAREFYGLASTRLQEWHRALQAGQFNEEAVRIALAAGMVRFRQVDDLIELWFEDDLKNAAERGYWFDRAVASPSPLYDFYKALSERAYEDSISPPRQVIASIEVIPPVPEGGGLPRPQGDTSWATGYVDAAAQSGDAADQREAVRAMAIVLSLDPAEDMAFAAAVMRSFDERMGFAAAPVEALIEEAEAMEPGPLRDAALKRAEDAVFDRLGHTMPWLAAGAAAGDDEDRASVLSKLLAEAQRLQMLRDDLNDPISPVSGKLAAISRLKAAAGILDLARNQDPKAKELMSIVTDWATYRGAVITPTMPFAGPAGIAAAQLDQTVQGFGHATDTLDALGDLMRGDATGLDRALESAGKLDEALSPRRFAEAMRDGFINAVASNVPILRTIYGWFTS